MIKAQNPRQKPSFKTKKGEISRDKPHTIAFWTFANEKLKPQKPQEGRFILFHDIKKVK